MPRSDDVIAALKAAARGGSLSACFMLGRLYDEGWGVKHDSRAAARWYLRAAEGGLPEAFYFVATAYGAGDGLPRDQQRALAWYRKAAAAGDRDAVYALAVATLEGYGVRKDETKGLRVLTRLARNHPAAMEYLAAQYFKRGRLSLAEKWATRAARCGRDSARSWLAAIENAARAPAARARSLHA